MKQFQSIEKLDEAALYVLELVSGLSILLLTFGLIASMASPSSENNTSAREGSPKEGRNWLSSSR